MADRKSPEIFGTIFRLLAVNPTLDHKLIAAALWKEVDNYDFDSVDMEADEACVSLGLAEYGIDPECPEDGEMVIFKQVV